MNEDGAVLGRVSVRLGDRFFYTGWPYARRHQNRMDPRDGTDANGDGKTNLAMIAAGPQRRFAPDGKTIVTVQRGEKMLDLEVTRIREDGLMLYTRRQPGMVSARGRRATAPPAYATSDRHAHHDALGRAPERQRRKKAQHGLSPDFWVWSSPCE